jgi:hypothetical protein
VAGKRCELTSQRGPLEFPERICHGYENDTVLLLSERGEQHARGLCIRQTNREKRGDRAIFRLRATPHTLDKSFQGHWIASAELLQSRSREASA